MAKEITFDIDAREQLKQGVADVHESIDELLHYREHFIRI